jgi:hypothetical protein
MLIEEVTSVVTKVKNPVNKHRMGQLALKISENCLSNQGTGLTAVTTAKIGIKAGV